MKTNHVIILISLLLPVMAMTGCGPVAAQNIVRVTPLSAGPSSSEPVPAVVNSSEAVNTPTPLNIQLPKGSAAAQILATYEAMKPDIENPLIFDISPVPITFDEFYDGFDIRKGLQLTDKLRSLDGKAVVMEGYMAPPLKPEIDWFVLTSVRLEFCPFCSSDADWPTDIAVIYITDDTLVATQVPVRVEGRMEIGSAVDPETGMVSLVRIYSDQISLIQ